MPGATIYDIAKRARVSPSTVSRALQDNPRIGAETRTRVQALAEEMGYLPSAAARGLKTNRSRVIGVIVHRIEDPYLTDVLRGIEEALHVSGYSLLLAASNRDPEREREVMQTMGENRVDGIIISSSDIDLAGLRRLDQFGIPSVLINSQSMQVPSTCSIFHDERYAMEQILRHLIDLGHERIAYLGNGRAGRTNIERQQGYEDAVKEAQLPPHPDYIVCGKNGMPHSGGEAMRYLLTVPERPTAVVSFNDMMAIGAIQAIQHAGYRVPDDISVTGLDNIDLTGYITPPLTTFRQPRYRLGHQAATMMLRTLGGDQPSEHETAHLRGELIVRQSTAPPNH